MSVGSETPQDRLYRLGATTLPKILMLQDRNPHSSTYGCFDRKFWHLKLTDFPSGMAQEFVLPLSLAWAHSFNNNQFYLNPSIREWVRAGIQYASRSAHRDGSCDDYYPFEKAAGAAAFSLYAFIESITICQLEREPFLPFLRRRGEWLAGHKESGRLSNHEALIANSLFRLARLSDDRRFASLARERLERLLGWSEPAEGWFYEYQGADPGYLTLTIANLAEMEASGDAPGLLREPISRAVRFLGAIQPPDGWLGGEWTSRNTNNFFPHGLEICGEWLPEALQINDRAVEALGDPPEYGDDTIIGHHAWSYLKAAAAWREDRPERTTIKEGDWPKAGLHLRQAGDFTLLVATKKGGNFRLYRKKHLIHADTGVSLIIQRGGKHINLVSHLWSEDNQIQFAENTFSVSGSMGRAKAASMTSTRLMLLRAIMLSVGRFNPDIMRQILQRMLITGKPVSAFRFQRDLALTPDGLEVRDRIDGSGEVIAAGIGASQSSIYTVMSRVWHSSQLQPWTDIIDHVIPGNQVRLNLVRRIPAI